MAHVLVVDDHEDTCRILARLLTRSGYEARCAFGGLAALRAVEDAAPNVMMLDVMMPDMSGLEVLERLRADPRFRALPVVMYSAAPEYREALRLGAQAFVVKSDMDWNALKSTIDHYASHC